MDVGRDSACDIGVKIRARASGSCRSRGDVCGSDVVVDESGERSARGVVAAVSGDTEESAGGIGAESESDTCAEEMSARVSADLMSASIVVEDIDGGGASASVALDDGSG